MISALSRATGAIVAASLGFHAAPVYQQPDKTEAKLLERVADAPGAARPLLDLAAWYYRALRFDEADARAREAQAAIARTRVASPARGDDRPNVAGRDVPMPDKIAHINPEYPPEAASAEIEGIVMIDLTVAPDGAVRDARVTRSISGLDRAAVSAVKQWRYRPTGVDAAVTVPVTLNFALGSDANVANRLDLAAWLVEHRAYDRGEAILAEALQLIAGRRAECDTAGQPPARAGRGMSPRKIKDVRPRYPGQALSSRASGFVTIEAVIGRAGRLCAARVVTPAPPFEEAALAAVRRWEFAPALRDGVPVPIATTVTVSFTIRTP